MSSNKIPTGPRFNTPIFVLVIFVFLASLEGLKYAVFPGINPWISKALTIVVVTAIAAIIFIYVRKKMESLFSELERLHAENKKIREQLIEELEERTTLDQVLKAIKQEWQDAFDAVDDWICIIDLDSTIRRSNKAVEKNYGLPIKEIIGKKCCELAHGSDVPLDICPINKMLKTRKRESAEIQVVNGRWMNITVDPLLDDNNEIVGAIHITHDITNKILMLNEREQLIQDLKNSLAQVKTLSGLLPICSICKKIRDDQGYWKQIESYIHNHTGVDFSHSICPECLKEHYPEHNDIDNNP